MAFLNSILNDPSELKIRQHSEAYDSLILMALSLNQSLDSLDFTQGNKRIHVTNKTAGVLWNNAINADFVGLSVSIKDGTASEAKCQDLNSAFTLV